MYLTWLAKEMFSPFDGRRESAGLTQRDKWLTRISSSLIIMFQFLHHGSHDSTRKYF